MHLRGRYMKKITRLKGIMSMILIFCMVLSLCNINEITAYAEEVTVEEASSENATVAEKKEDGNVKETTEAVENQKETSTKSEENGKIESNKNQESENKNNNTESKQQDDQEQSTDSTENDVKSQGQEGVKKENNNNIAVHTVQNGIDSDMMLGKLLTALGLSADDFTVDNIQAAGIKDRNFAQAVYDSVIADQDNFCYDIIIKNLDTGEIEDPGVQWNPEKIIKDGQNDGIISSIENSDTISEIKLILSYFSGKIDAEKKEIKSIEGIKILRRAWKILLNENDITDISCMEMGEGEICHEDSEWGFKKYFGDYGRNVYIYLAENPLTTIFEETNGRLNLDLGQGYEGKLPDVIINHLITGKEKGGISTPFLSAKVMQKGKGVNLSSSGFNIAERLTTMNINKNNIISRNGDGFEGITIEGINGTGKAVFGFPYERVMIHWFAGIETDHITNNEFALIANRAIYVNMYTNVNINYTSNGCIHLHKQDDQGNAIKGAEFNLYKCSDTADTIVPEDKQNPSVGKVYTTDENGDIYASGLEDGEYYFVETKVPENYNQKVYGTKCNISDATGGSVNFDIAESDRDARYTLYKESNSSQGTTDQCLAVGLKANANGKVTYHVIESGNYYLVKSDVLSVSTVKKDAINVTNKTRNVNAWDGDSLESTKDDGTTETHNISNGFYVKGAVPEKMFRGQVMAGTGDDTADQLSFSLKDTKSSPFYEATIKWTKSLSETDDSTAGQMSYRIKKNNEENTDKVTYCKDLSEVQSEIEKKIQKLAGVEYRNVTMDIKYGGGYESDDKWSADNDNIPTTTVTNPKTMTTTLKVYKEDADHKGLENAEFTMYRDAITSDKEADVVQITVDGVKKDVVVFDKQVTKKESASSEKAVAEFKGLQSNSTYYLAETKFPTGYRDENSMGKVYTVKTNSDGDVTIDGAKANGELKGHVFSITLTNIRLNGLPRAGMDGGYGQYTLLSMLLITTAGAWLWSRRSRKVK